MLLPSSPDNKFIKAFTKHYWFYMEISLASMYFMISPLPVARNTFLSHSRIFYLNLMVTYQVVKLNTIRDELP